MIIGCFFFILLFMLSSLQKLIVHTFNHQRCQTTTAATTRKDTRTETRTKLNNNFSNSQTPQICLDFCALSVDYYMDMGRQHALLLFSFLLSSHCLLSHCQKKNHWIPASNSSSSIMIALDICKAPSRVGHFDPLQGGSMRNQIN